MAEGGVALRPTRRLMGEAGPEAVIPLHRLGDLSRRMGGGGGGVTVNVGGITVGGGVTPEAVGAQTSAAVIRAIREDGGFRGQIVRTTRRSLRG